MTALTKFAANPYSIRNSTGDLVSMDYLRRYIHCWCRVSDGFIHNRKANIEYFMSPAFLTPLKGKTASEIGKIASLDPRWGMSRQTTKSRSSVQEPVTNPANNGTDEPGFELEDHDSAVRDAIRANLTA